jgi:hypothetical protein
MFSKLMTPFNPAAQNFLASTVLFVLGLVDLLRGVLHTFFVNWAVRTFAKLDLSLARQDQLTLLGAFGISNLLTGVIFILVSIEAAQLSELCSADDPLRIHGWGYWHENVRGEGAVRILWQVFHDGLPWRVPGDVCLVATSSIAPKCSATTPPDC